MSLNTRRLLFILVNCFTFAFLSAQTLYWVGGSGNFNDPKHWSLSSGGPAANLTPNSTTDVVFDENSSSDFAVIDIKFPLNSSIKSLIVNNNGVSFSGLTVSSLTVSGNVQVNTPSGVKFFGNIYFKSSGDEKKIFFGGGTINANLFFGEGEYFIQSANLTEGKKIVFENGKYNFTYGLIRADQLIAKGNTTHFVIEKTAFYIKSSVKILGKPKFETNGFGFFGPFNDSLKTTISPGVNFGANSKLSSASTNAVGEATIYPITPCNAAACTSIFSLEIDPANTGTFDLVVTNTLCPTTAAQISTTGLVPGVTYTVANVCQCSIPYTGFLYDPNTFNVLTTIVIVPGIPTQTTSNFNFNPSALAINPLGLTQPSCNLSCNGSMNFFISGGTTGGPYTVTVTGPSPTVVVTGGAIALTGLCKGVYNLSGVDANGCTASTTRTLTAPSQLTATAITSSVTCKSACNGAFGVNTGNTGTSPYSVFFSTGATQTMATIGTASVTGLCPTVISATITDAKGCTTSTTGTIVEPSNSLTAVFTQTNLTCNGVCTGAAAATAGGGTPPYSYNWSPATSTAATASSLCAGQKTLIVSDFNGCAIAAQVFTITQPSPIVLSTSFTNVACAGSCTGAIDVAPSGGVGAPWTFTWVTATGPSTFVTGNVTYQNTLCANTYSIYGRDANLCVTPIPTVVTITQPPAVTLAIVSKSVSCFGLSDGGATVTASGGNSSSYSYSWSPGAFTSSAVSTFSAGTYNLLVLDAQSCPTNTSVTIIQPLSGLTAVVTQTNLTCNSANAPCNGIINISPTGGTTPYHYSLVTSSSTNTNSPPYTNLCVLPGPNQYTAIVSDNSGCAIVPVVVNLTQPLVLVPNLAVTSSVSCFSGTNGALSGTASGGNGSYTYTWTTPTLGTFNTANISNLPAGSYTLTVKDASNCTASNSVAVNQPTADIAIALSTNSITCFSLCNGVLNSTVTGGTAPYTYTWTNSTGSVVSNSSNASGLCPGSYTLTVRDNNLCVKSATTSVLSPGPIVMTQTTTPVACFGNSNGSATVNATGGTPSFTYSFNSSPTVTNTTGLISGQPTGTYMATATDNAGCTQTISFIVGSPALLVANISGLVGSCNVCNGMATVTPVGGTGPFNASWTSTAGVVGTSTNVTGLCPGNYSVTLTDSHSCVATNTIAIQQIVSVTVVPAGSSILCNGATTGSASVLAGGGVPAYTYSWSAVAPTPSIPAQTSSVLTGVGAGTYAIIVSDNTTPSACSNSAVIVLTQPPALTVTATQTQVSCFGYTNAAITTSVSGGTLPVNSYSWSSSPSITNPGTSSITGIGVSAGSSQIYSLTIKDNNLCVTTKTYNVTQPSSITVVTSSINPSACTSPNGSICVNPSGGSGAGYTYSWTPVVSPNSGTTSCMTNLNGGNYQVVVTDGTGCTNTFVTSLVNANGPTLTVVSRSVDCYGASTGAATVTAAGSGAFTFVWTPTLTVTNTTTSSIATGVTSNTYNISCTDINGCVTNTSIPIAQAASITLNSTVTPVTCFSFSNGIIVVSPTVQTGPTPTYTFAWSPAVASMTGQSTSSVSGLPSNIYSLNLTSLRTGSACLNTYTFNVTQPSSITVSAVTTSLQCNGIPTGSIVATASGGFGSLNYTWSPSPASGSSPTVMNLPANTGTNPPAYTLTVTDQNTCTVVKTFTVTEPSPVTSTISFVSASCSNSCNATASLVGGGGTPSYSFSWGSSTVTTSTLGSLCAGTYSGTVTDSHGCALTKTVAVVAPTPLSVTLTPANPLCNAACNGSISTTVSGAQGTVSYVWSPAGSGQNPTGLCASVNPNYTLVATDQNSCQTTSVVTLVNPPALMASVSATNPVCHNDLNGLAVVSLSNAVGAGHYTWTPTSPTKTTQSVSGLSSGNYTVFVRDDNNCLANATFTLDNPLAISVTSILVNPTCLQSNGSITVTATGGTTTFPTPYTYSWAGGLGTAPVVSGLGAGVYSVIVSDSYSCSTNATINLSNANGPSGGNIATTSVVCNSQCTGAATLDVATITGGTSPYVVEWQAPATTTANPTGSLCAGNYIAKITDATGCISFTSTTINEPLPISISGSVAALPLCPGICDGTIALNATGGIAPYTYTWAPISSNAATETNLCSGDYTVVVGYNGVCQQSVTFNMPIQTSITIVPTTTNNICFGDCNGIATVLVSGGTGPYSASWSNAQTGFLANGLCPGDYTVSVTDNNGCNNTATTTITGGTQITASTSVSQPSCGMCDGTAGITASGGTGPYNYSWSNAATTPSIANLCAGLYQVVISDALSCSQTHTVIVNNSNGITGETFNVTDIPCSGSCVGAVTVIAQGGNAPISYNWLNPVSTGTTINNLCPGTFYVQMTDAQGCVRISSVSINPLVTLSVSPFVQQPACGVSNGSLYIAIAGGTPSYNIVWNPPAGATTSLTGLNSGVYSYTVTESGTHSCSVSNTINISNANGPVIAATQTNVNCYGGLTGAVAITATAVGTPTYSWSTGVSTPNLSNIGAGIITLTVTDVNSCVTIKSFTLTQGTQMQLGFANVHNPKCFGDCDGLITLVPSGGFFPYSFNWSSSATTNPATSLCDGTYSAVVTDAKGCPISSPVYTIASASSISVTASKTNPSCSSTNDGILNVTALGGSPTYSFSWQGPASFSSTAQSISNVYYGAYTVTVLDSLGCSKDSVLQLVPTITVVANGGFDQTICPITGTTVLDAAGSVGSENYRWSVLGQSGTTLALTATYTVSGLTQPTSFIVIATSSVAACFDVDTVDIGLHTLPIVDAGANVIVPVYSSVTIGGNPTSFGAVSMTWSPGQYLDNANAFNPIASNTVNVVYTVTVTDFNGCIESGTVTVELFPELNISNGFTPNGDGKNDTWIIDYISQFPDNTVEIFNRWGDIIFTSKGYSVPFDGKYKGSDLPVGTYYYVIKLNHPGYPKPITGPITIFR